MSAVNGAGSQQDKYRDHLYEAGTKWRSGAPPRYELVNALFEEGKSADHVKDSLEAIVQRLVKSWEMEIQHKVDVSQWRTIASASDFRLRCNGSRAMTAEELARRGSYNCLLETCALYRASEETLESSHEQFAQAFTKGFAFEVTKVLTGPPTVTFTWRHWAPFTGRYGGRRGDGRLVEMHGMTVVGIDEKLRIESVDSYFDTSSLFSQLKLQGSDGASSGKGRHCSIF